MTLRNNRIVTIIALSKKAFGQYKKNILVLTILGFVGGLFEGIGVNALIPLLSIAIGDGQNGTDIISKAVERFFTAISIEFNIPNLLIFIIIMFISKAIVQIITDYISIKITADYETKTRNTLFRKILKSDWPHLMKHKLGHLETAMLIDIKQSGRILRTISAIITLVTSLTIYLIVAVNISFIVTLITAVLGLIIFLIFKPLNFRIKVLSQEVNSTNKSIAHHITENTLGIKTVKSMSVREGVEKKARVLFEILRSIQVKIFVIRSFIKSFIEPFGLIFICLIFFFTYQLPSFNFAVLVAIVYLIQKIFVYIRQLQKNLNTLNEKIPFLQSALFYLDEAIENEEEDNGTGKFIFEKELEFRDVSFQYDNQDNNNQPVIKNISFKVKKGEMVGIIGPSGVGKTTLVDLILRLLNPTQGSIVLDGKNINEIDLKSWRDNIGYVSQDIFLMNDSVANNIKFYKDSISHDKLVKVAKMANIYDFIMELPDKFDTVIGERGVRLSAGQRQRIVIARVLARDPQILVLDEATSALDNESEIQIQKVIEGLRGRVTVLVIAHRLSTVEDSDKLIVLEGGQISEQGAPKDLLKNKGSYFYKSYNLRG